MTLVQLDDYLVAACVIKDLFQLSPQVVASSLASFAPGNGMASSTGQGQQRI
jgi:hypothetical protein